MTQSRLFATVVDQTQLLQSSSKTYAGIIASKLIDEGKLDPNATVESYLADFKGIAREQPTDRMF